MSSSLGSRNRRIRAPIGKTGIFYLPLKKNTGNDESRRLAETWPP
jgi:hypothetical protein